VSIHDRVLPFFRYTEPERKKKRRRGNKNPPGAERTRFGKHGALIFPFSLLVMMACFYFKLDKNKNKRIINMKI
jgi:hypothetical protein